MRGGYIIQRHNEIRDLEAEILQAVCTDVEVVPGSPRSYGGSAAAGRQQGP